jgi:hypothetical protein
MHNPFKSKDKEKCDKEDKEEKKAKKKEEKVRGGIPEKEPVTLEWRDKVHVFGRCQMIL